MSSRIWLAVAFLGLTACQDQASEQKPAEEVVAKLGAVTERTVTVTLNQGTNMAMDVTSDGARVISLQGQLFLLEQDQQAVALTDPYFDAREPQVASDGRVVFHGYRNGNWDIWLTDVSGTEPKSLTDDIYDDREPQLSRDGSKLVYASDRGGSYDVWQLDLTNDEITQLTATQGNAYSPAMNDQNQLAYAYFDGGMSSLMVDQQPIISHRGTISGVQWSPAGKHVSYQLLGPQGAQMHVIGVDGKGVGIISQPGSDVFPFRAAWLDENTLSYVADGDIVRQTIGQPASKWPFAVQLTLTRHDYPRRVRDYDSERIRAALGISNPVINSDGGTVYFSALGDIWRWQSSANDLTRMTDTPAAEFSLALHSDDNQLAYISDEGGRLQLMVMDLDSGTARAIAINANQISFPSWSPDGKYLGFFVDVPGNPLGGQLTILELASGETMPLLLPMPAQPISWSADGEHVAITRLNPYSSRYREGIYELVVTARNGGEKHTIVPVAHKSITDATLQPDGSMSYVQGGYLHRLELDSELQPVEAAGQITDELTDWPRFSGNGEHLVYLAADRLRYKNVATGEVRDITPTIPWQMAAPKDRYVIRAGRVFVGHGDSYLVNQDIVVQGEKIVRISDADPAVQPDVDASMHTVVPGLFEMHAHMGETSEPQGRTWLGFGITSVRDPGSNPYVAKERQEAWDSGRRLGPRTHITGFLTDGNRVFYSMAEGILSDEHLDLALQRAKDLQLDFIKTYVRLPDQMQKRVVDFAHSIGIPVSSHELYPAVAHGMDHVEHIGGTSRRGYQPKVSRLGYSYQDVIELLSAGGMGITATAVLPGFAVIVGQEPDWFDTEQFDQFYGPAVRKGYEMMVPRFGPQAAATAEANGTLLRALDERDALLVTGTDAPFVPYGAGLHAEFRLYSRAGVSNARILHMATMKSAEAAGVNNELGSIEAGKLADLVVVDGDPLNDIRDLDNVVMTIKHGFRYPLAELLTTP